MAKKTKLLSRDDLRERGINLSKSYLRRLIATGRFPRPVRLFERVLMWPEAEIEKWLKTAVDAPRVAPDYAVKLGAAVQEKVRAKKEAAARARRAR